jgi:hypothetical protein
LMILLLMNMKCDSIEKHYINLSNN